MGAGLGPRSVCPHPAEGPRGDSQAKAWWQDEGGDVALYTYSPFL